MNVTLMLRRCTVSAGVLLGAAGVACAGTETSLYDFTGQADGALPGSPVVFDKAGTLYGTTQVGGTGAPAPAENGDGTIFALSVSGKLTPVHEFTGGIYGEGPITGVTLAGSTLFGGAQSLVTSGLLYSIGTDGSDFTVLHQFDGTDGERVTGQLVTNGSMLYGLTFSGGPGYTGPQTGDGVLFALQQNGNFQVLHDFTGKADGSQPSSLLIDAAGNLFGSDGQGGTSPGGTGCGKRAICGVVFEYAPATGVFTVLHSFTNTTDGIGPNLGSIGPDGTLYGTTSVSAAFRAGSLFALTPSSGGYAFSTLASFSTKIGGGPSGGPVRAPNGALVGATSVYLYGYYNNVLHILTNFDGGQDGSRPLTPPTFGPGAAVYGTTYSGGIVCTTQGGITFGNGCGIVYKYSLQ